MWDLYGSPAELENDDEGGVVEESGEVGCDVAGRVAARQTPHEDEGEGRGDEQSPEQVPT